MATNHPPSAPQESWRRNWAELTHDDIVEEIHAHRAELFERFHGDEAAIFQYYKEQEKQNSGRRSTDQIQPRHVPAGR
jgi:hypothetical protein